MDPKLQGLFLLPTNGALQSDIYLAGESYNFPESVFQVMSLDLLKHTDYANFFDQWYVHVRDLVTLTLNHHCVRVCGDLPQHTCSYRNFKLRIISFNETCIYGYDPEAKHQCSKWTNQQSQRPKKACQVRSITKSMLVVFFNIPRAVDCNFLPQGQTANTKYNCHTRRHLREKFSAHEMNSMIATGLFTIST